MRISLSAAVTLALMAGTAHAGPCGVDGATPADAARIEQCREQARANLGISAQNAGGLTTSEQIALGVLGVVVIAAIASGGGDGGSSSTTTTTTTTTATTN